MVKFGTIVSSGALCSVQTFCNSLGVETKRRKLAGKSKYTLQTVEPISYEQIDLIKVEISKLEQEASRNHQSRVSSGFYDTPFDKMQGR